MVPIQREIRGDVIAQHQAEDFAGMENFSSVIGRDQLTSVSSRGSVCYFRKVHDRSGKTF